MTMRRIMCVLGAALLAGLTTPIAAGDDATYDLRGPAPQKAQTIVTKMVVRIKDADMQVKLGGQNLTLKQTLIATTEEEEKFVAVEGRQVTKSQAKIVKDVVDITAVFMGMPNKDSMTNE